MDVTALLRLAASLCLCAGLALLYLRWRDRQRGRWRVATGWGLVVLGLVGWLVSGHGDVAVSDGAVAVMVLALAVVAWHATSLPAPAKAPRPRAGSEHDGLDLGRGYWSRAVARTLGCVIAAPAAGLMIGILWRAYVPGTEADTLMMMAIIACLVTAGAWVVQLASTRPWRALMALVLTAVVAAALIYLPMGLRP